MSLVKKVGTVGGGILISRILGFIRDIIIAYKLGAGILSDAFFVAFKIPNLFRRLFAEGAFSAAFVPIFAGKLIAGRKEAISFADNVLSILMMILLVITLFMQVFMPQFLTVIAPGFNHADDSEKIGVTIELARIMFPYLLFISAVSLLSGVLNSVEKFAAAAFSPVILNICMISGVLLLGHYTDTPAHALAIGVVVSGVLQLLWLIYACYKSGVVVRLKKFTFNHDTKILYKKMVPGIIGAGVVQINMLIDTILATFIPKGVSYLYYADRINQLPMAVIGTAMGIVLLPTMSAYLKKGKIDEANKIQNNAIEFSMLLTIPAAAALITVGLPMLSVMFERGEFSYDDAYNTSLALCAYAVGLPAFVLIKIFVPTFFANSDTSTPVKIAMKCVVINLILNFALFIPLQHVGLALATSISAWVNALLLGKALHKQKLIKIDKKLYKLITKMLGAAILMAAILYEYKYFAHDYIYDNELYIEIASIVVLIVVGTIAYFAGCKLFRVSTVNNLGRFTRKNR